MSRQSRYTASGIAAGAGVALIAASASIDNNEFLTGDPGAFEQSIQLASFGVALAVVGLIGFVATAAATEPTAEEATPWLHPTERSLTVELQAACAAWRRELAAADSVRRQALTAARPVHCEPQVPR